MNSPACAEGRAWWRVWGQVALARLPLLARVVAWWRERAEIRRVEKSLRIMLAELAAAREKARTG